MNAARVQNSKTMEWADVHQSLHHDHAAFWAPQETRRGALRASNRRSPRSRSAPPSKTEAPPPKLQRRDSLPPPSTPRKEPPKARTPSTSAKWLGAGSCVILDEYAATATPSRPATSPAPDLGGVVATALDLAHVPLAEPTTPKTPEGGLPRAERMVSADFEDAGAAPPLALGGDDAAPAPPDLEDAPAAVSTPPVVEGAATATPRSSPPRTPRSFLRELRAFEAKALILDEATMALVPEEETTPQEKTAPLVPEGPFVLEEATTPQEETAPLVPEEPLVLEEATTPPSLEKEPRPAVRPWAAPAAVLVLAVAAACVLASPAAHPIVADDVAAAAPRRAAPAPPLLLPPPPPSASTALPALPPSPPPPDLASTAPLDLAAPAPPDLAVALRRAPPAPSRAPPVDVAAPPFVGTDVVVAAAPAPRPPPVVRRVFEKLARRPARVFAALRAALGRFRRLLFGRRRR